MKSKLLITDSPNRSPRRGVTLVEVLISMGILAIGLLGAASMFPVGSYFMQKGEVADRGAAIAQAAFADLVARGDLSPENWQTWDTGTAKYRPMGARMRNWMEVNGRGNQTAMNNDLGFVYVIDPLGTAAAIGAAGREGTLNNAFRNSVGRAPFDAVRDGESIDTAPVDVAGTNRWLSFNGVWPVKRLSSNEISLGGQPSEPLAQQIYTSGDDLAFSLAEDEDGATQQRLIGPDTNGDGVPEEAIARQSRGDYSWMTTITPTQSDAREALALNPSAYYFDVSVVVFYKRAVANISTSERLVAGRVVSTGTGGGEILLTRLSRDSTDPFEELRQGQWVMVSGPHPNSTVEEPLFFTQWYRVLAIDDEQRDPIVNSKAQRLVGLRGPDWPWDTNARVRVGLFPGAVAVHTKTMRLESFGSYAGN